MRKLLGILILLSVVISCSKKQEYYCLATDDNDLVRTLSYNGARMHMYSSIEQTLQSAPAGAAVLLLNPDYPGKVHYITSEHRRIITEKNLHVFAEFADLDAAVPTIRSIEKERVVVLDSIPGGPARMSLMSVNCAKYFEPSADIQNPLMVIAKVAGLDKAEYGIQDTQCTPLLYKVDSSLYLSTSQLSCFASVRFMPEHRWKQFYEAFLGSLQGSSVQIKTYPSTVYPTFDQRHKVSSRDIHNAIVRGVDWYRIGNFLVNDGKDGILEGHLTSVDFDGNQLYRNWMRADVQGESAMALSLAAAYTGHREYDTTATRIVDYMFREFRDGPRNDPESPSYGLLGWGADHKHHYYGDDNARAILGAIASATLMDNHSWDNLLVEAILGNYRTTGSQGFRGSRLLESELAGKTVYERHTDPYWHNTWPHFESWLWACYIWLYRQTGYEPLLEMSQNAIRITMSRYPNQWYWTNGMEQERARMVLPLAWLYRANPTEENLGYLKLMVSELLKNQQPCGAIRDEIGTNNYGQWGKIKSNAAYGSGEAPLIFDNGDPIADMLYTNNFALFGLVEAYAATADPQIKQAAQSLADFMVKIQVSSKMYPTLDGSWMRAFNYENWDYWAQDSDSGWGALCTLTGWIQGWIVSSLVLMEENTSYWDLTQTSTIGHNSQEIFYNMLEKCNIK